MIKFLFQIVIFIEYALKNSKALFLYHIIHQYKILII